MVAAGSRAAGVSEPLPTLLVIPTGIGCDQGGFAGDALPVARLLAAASDCLITHPNVMNGAALDVMDAGITPIEGCPVHHIGMGDQAVARGRQQTGHRQGITGEAPLITADPCGDHQQRGQRLAHTSSTASSRNHCPSGLGSEAVIAQRKGSP